MYVLAIAQLYIFIRTLLASRKSIVIDDWKFYENEFRFSVHDRDPRYYADGEDAYSMRRDLTSIKILQ